MTDPLVSVIIPTFNRASVISHAIDCVLSQTYKNLELIVVDDGSTDETRERLRQYGSRIRVITQANAGPAAARNRGIAASHGEIISFLDSDDIWLPHKIERQVKLLHKVGHSIPCCICNATLQTANGPSMSSFHNSLLSPTEDEGLWVNAPKVLMHRFLLFNQTVAIRRQALENVGGFDETLRYLEDYDLALRLSLLGPFAFIRESLTVYRLGFAGSLSVEAQKEKLTIKENAVKILERVSQILEERDEYVQLRLPMRRALRKAQRSLWMAQLGQKRTLRAHLLSRFLERAEHYCGAAADRSPWFLPMKTLPPVAKATGLPFAD